VADFRDTHADQGTGVFLTGFWAGVCAHKTTSVACASIDGVMCLKWTPIFGPGFRWKGVSGVVRDEGSWWFFGKENSDISEEKNV